MNSIKDFFFNKIINWFNFEEKTDCKEDIIFDSKYLESKPIKEINLKELTKIPQSLFILDYDILNDHTLFKIFPKISTTSEYIHGIFINGIVKPFGGISKIELIHNGIIIDVPKYNLIEKNTTVCKLEERKLKITNSYKINCIYFEFPIYPGPNTRMVIYDNEDKKYQKITWITTNCHVRNSKKLLENYRVWEKRMFGNDTLFITIYNLYSNQYKSKPINLKPIKSLFRKRYKNKRKILSKYLYKDVIGIICSY